jgi:pimeloyl-ACP methyl ester carboxylesterase
VADSYPAFLDPKFASAGLDPGYLTTMPGTKGDVFYYTPNADPSVIALDEELKDTFTTTELAEGTPLISSPPPATAPSRAITVPTLVVLGDHDNIACGPPEGLDCTQTNVTAQEAPYYSPQAHMQVTIIPETGHDIQLHRSAADADQRILDWLGGQQ